MFDPARLDAESRSSEWRLRFFGFAGNVRYLGDLEHLSCDLGGPHVYVKRPLESVEVPLRRGLRRYFDCPACGKHCSDLILIDNGLCRDCYCAQPSTFSKRHRDALLLEAKHALMNREYSITQVTAVVVAAPAKPAILASARVEPHEETTDMQTQTAIDRGRGMDQWDIYALYSGFDYDAVMSLPTGGDYHRSEKVLRVGEVPELNLRVVRDALEKGQDGVQAVCLEYGSRPDQQSVGLFVDMRFDELIVVLAQDPYNLHDPGWQRLEIDCHASNRLRWICPVLGVHADTLYRRNTLFASRQAQHLVHRSQRVAKRRGHK